MLKEIFEISPRHRNELLIFSSFFSLTFLQCYLFKPEIFELDMPILFGVISGMAISFRLSTSLFSILLYVKWDAVDNVKYIEQNKLLTSIISFISLLSLTYISYLIEFSFSDFIKLFVIVEIFKCTFIYVLLKIKDYKKPNDDSKKSND